MNNKFKILCVFFSLVASVANADSEKKPQLKILIDQTYMVPGRILSPIPSLNSALGRLELSEVQLIVANATPDQTKFAARDAKNKTVSFFADTIKGLDLDKLPETKALFKQVRFTEDQQLKAFKSHFKRPRPYVTDATLSTCMKPVKGKELASYPSGHATMAFSMAIVLSNLLPEKAPAILERANIYAHNRLICGFHHQSDISAGQVMGTLIAIELLQNLEFHKQFKKSAAELRAAGLTSQ